MRVTMCCFLVAGAMAAGCGNPEAVAREKRLADPASSAHTAGVGTDGAAAPARRAASAPAAATTALREVSLPAGTQLSVTLDTPVNSETSHVEQAVTAHLSNAVRIDGETVLSPGARITGVVTDATRSAKVKGRAHVAMRFDSLSPQGDNERYAIHTAPIARTAESTKRKDAVEIGAPAAGGALIGALVGGKKGALVGTAIGGGAGTAAVLSTRGKEVHLPKGTALTIHLTAPVTVRVGD